LRVQETGIKPNPSDDDDDDDDDDDELMNTRFLP
jgi:hypothetical protein